jgi:maltose O-acetyltransferase
MEPTQRERMLAGELYDPLDPELARMRARARDMCGNLNATLEIEADRRRALTAKLFAKGGDTVILQPPFFCDYGAHIELGEKVFFNFNCVILDVCRVTIGAYTLFGPAAQVLTATHPLDAKLRRTVESGKPVTIGSDCWIGAGALILPGVTIGDGTVIGAGAVVTKDVPSSVLAVGNPCRIVRDLTAADLDKPPR